MSNFETITFNCQKENEAIDASPPTTFVPTENIMPDRFNTISESQLFPQSSIGNPHSFETTIEISVNARTTTKK